MAPGELAAVVVAPEALAALRRATATEELVVAEKERSLGSGAAARTLHAAIL
jgi:hypothetical protein